MGNMLEMEASGVVSRPSCASGLAVMVLIAVIGASEDAGSGSGSMAKTVAPIAVQYTLEDHEDGFDPLPQAIQATAAHSGVAGATNAQQHRKQVFDERRARFEDGSDQHSVRHFFQGAARGQDERTIQHEWPLSATGCDRFRSHCGIHAMGKV